MQSAVAFCLLLRSNHGVQNFRFGLLVALLRPGAAHDQVVFQPNDRITERPSVRLGLGPIGGRIIGAGMCSNSIGDMLDQSGAKIAACSLDCPFRDRMNGKIVVAVDPQRGDTETKASRRESAGAAARDSLKGRDSPLIVHDVEDDRRLIGRCEDQRGVEVRFCRRAVADPRSRDLGVVLDRRRHSPADGLNVLSREVSRHREEAMLLRRIEDRHLPPL